MRKRMVLLAAILALSLVGCGSRPSGEENRPLIQKYVDAIARVEAEIDALRAEGGGAVPASGKTCPQCGAEVEEDALFCEACGAQL